MFEGLPLQAVADISFTTAFKIVVFLLSVAAA